MAKDFSNRNRMFASRKKRNRVRNKIAAASRRVNRHK